MQRFLHSRKADPLLSSSRPPSSRQPGWLHLDLAELAHRSQAETLLNAYALDAILCIGGMTDVEGCESDADRAMRINARGPGVLAAYAQGRALPFVYFSTEYVFDGSSENPGPYQEDAPTHALSVYGKSKLAGEHAVLAAHPDALIIRTTVVYGPDAGEKNFLYSTLRNLASGKPMRVAEDQISTPTFNQDLVRATCGLVDARATGIFHVCGPERMSRLAFAQAIARHFSLETGLLQGVATTALQQKAPRPLHAGLAIQKLASRYPPLHMGTLAESLERCAADLGPFILQARASTSPAERT